VGILLREMGWMGLWLRDMAHVERCEGSWLWYCTIELVLSLLDDRLEVFEDLEVVFSWW
jgi:hypothetical protein